MTTSTLLVERPVDEEVEAVATVRDVGRSLVNTCNTWIAEALRAGGGPITPVWAVTAGNLLFQAERCRQVMRR